MKLIADESVDYEIVKALRLAGVDVFAICEQASGILDTDVLQIAQEKGLLLLTEDKDFGELVFRLRLPHSGILLLRLGGIPSQQKSLLVSNMILTKGNDLLNHFAVLDDVKLRIKINNQ